MFRKHITPVLFAGILFLLSVPEKIFSQESGSVTVGGDINKFYPVSFYDGNWINNKPTRLTIGRSDVHTNSDWRGSLSAEFTFHVTGWGNGSEFITANIYTNLNLGVNFIAGWQDVSATNGDRRIIIWLKGGGTTYYYSADAPVIPQVHDGVQYPLPYQQTNGPTYTFKTTKDPYVNTNGANEKSAYFTNIGIGLNNPQVPFHILNNNNTSSILLESNSAGWGSGMIFNNTAAQGKSYGIYSGAYGGLHISDNNLSVDRLFINSAGKVGIGTSNPSENLQLGDRFTFQDGGWKGVLSNMAWSSSQNANVRLVTAPATGMFFTDLGNIIFQNAPSAPAGTALSDAVHSMIIHNSGQVGIGTSYTKTSFSDQSTRLFVEGGIRARKIRVDQSSWPDYVFHKDFKLPSLSEVEKYIQQHKHLPEVPSAKEVEEKGLDLGNNQAILLKKIEELTLYSIGQDKTIQQQNKQIQKQEQEIETLKKQIQTILDQLNTRAHQ